MSVEQYQRIVNSLDKEIADLEKKKAEADGKAASARKKAASVNISKTASASMIKSKVSQIERYKSDEIKSQKSSADFQKKISEKRKKRNDANLRLQKAMQNEQKKQISETKRLQELYEKRIGELQKQLIPQQNITVEDDGVNEPKYDVFVSHAWEDKETFVDEFVDELRVLGVKVWYDKSQIKWGDSMRSKIDEGLSKSRFGVAILSPDYIAEHKYWTKAELDGLFQLESINGKMLLPIWHNLTKQQVMKFSPVIASKLAMNTATMTPKEIAEELVKLLPEKGKN